MGHWAWNKSPAGVKRGYFELIRQGLSGSAAATTDAPRDRLVDVRCGPRAPHWSGVLYTTTRASGQGHHRALRCTAARWSRILWRCLHDGTDYDPRCTPTVGKRSETSHHPSPADPRPVRQRTRTPRPPVTHAYTPIPDSLQRLTAGVCIIPPKSDLLHERDRIPQRRYRRAVRAQGYFPAEQAALKCLYLVTHSPAPGRGRTRWTMRWKPVLSTFDITFRRPLASRGDLLMKTAGNTVNEQSPSGDSPFRATHDSRVAERSG